MLIRWLDEKMFRFLKWTSGYLERWKMVYLGGGWKIVEIEGVLGCLMILYDTSGCLRMSEGHLRKSEKNRGRLKRYKIYRNHQKIFGASAVFCLLL